MKRPSVLLLSVSAAVLAFARAGAVPAAPALSAPGPVPPTEPAAASAPAQAPVSPSAPTSAPGGVREIELPAETGSYRQGPGVELAQAFCLTCHSMEYCETQPLSGGKYWAATVKKMKEKFGAPLPDEVIVPLTQYLTATYGKPEP